MSEKILVYVGSKELGDGVQGCTFRTKDELIEAIDNLLENINTIYDAGEKFSVELVVTTEEEFNALPEL